MTPRPIDVLILAAFPPELALLRDALGEAEGILVPDMADFCGVIGELEVACQAVGIGLVAAALGTARCLSLWKARKVVVVGTCGAYEGRGLDLGDVVRARRVHLASTAAAEGRAGVPDVMPTMCAVDANLSEQLAALGVKSADVATTLAVTTDDALAQQIARRYDCDVEHLEAFSMAMACAAADVPLAMVLGVANRVGATGRAEWKSHHVAAARAAGETVRAWLARTTRPELPPAPA
jgi:nucleoside phosphorylase